MQGIIFIGLQASGKSTFYDQHFCKTHIRLSMDMLKTRHRETLLFTACLAAKQPVAIDNTNPTKSEREKYISGFKQHRFEVVGYYFASNLEDCLKRNAMRKGRIEPSYQKSALKAHTTSSSCPTARKGLTACFM